MKIMRMFNEVSSRQQEMEVKFELMKRTLNLLKKFNRFDVIDLEAKFNNTPIRWSNLKSKVNLAKQRLGPTIQEESKAISQDLKSFAKLINEMRTTILDSDLFDHSCDYEKATKFLDYYDEKFSSLQNQAILYQVKLVIGIFLLQPNMKFKILKFKIIFVFSL